MCVNEVRVCVRSVCKQGFCFFVVVAVVFLRTSQLGGKHKDFTIQVGGESSFHYLTDKVTLTFC